MAVKGKIGDNIVDVKLSFSSRNIFWHSKFILLLSVFVFSSPRHATDPG